MITPAVADLLAPIRAAQASVAHLRPRADAVAARLGFSMPNDPQEARDAAWDRHATLGRASAAMTDRISGRHEPASYASWDACGSLYDAMRGLCGASEAWVVAHLERAEALLDVAEAVSS